jgi:hypothetical protein
VIAPDAPEQILAGTVKVDVTDGLTVIVLLTNGAIHPPSLIDNVIVFGPEVLQVTECGPTVDALAGLAPTPKFQE